MHDARARALAWSVRAYMCVRRSSERLHGDNASFEFNIWPYGTGATWPDKIAFAVSVIQIMRARISSRTTTHAHTHTLNAHINNH